MSETVGIPAGAQNADSIGLDHMQAFIAVVETGSQVLAAKRLELAATTISRRIERVQEHYGGGLFEAGNSGSLSTRGALVEDAFRMARAELLRTRERLAADGPVLRVGFVRIARPLVQRALGSQGKRPSMWGFDVRLFELTSEEQERAVISRELDIAICYARPELAGRQGIEESLVTEQPYALVVPEAAWAGDQLDIEALSALSYVYTTSRSTSARANAEERWLQEHGLAPSCRIECAKGAELLAYAGAGFGYGFLPALWSLADHRGAVFIPALESVSPVRIATYSLAHVTPLVRKLREELPKAAREGLGAVAGGREPQLQKPQLGGRSQ